MKIAYQDGEMELTERDIRIVQEQIRTKQTSLIEENNKRIIDAILSYLILKERESTNWEKDRLSVYLKKKYGERLERLNVTTF